MADRQKAAKLRYGGAPYAIHEKVDMLKKNANESHSTEMPGGEKNDDD